VQSARGTPPFSGPNGPEGSGEIKKDRGGGSGRRMLRAASLALGWPDNVAANIPHCPSSMAVCPAPLSIMISERFLGHGGCPHARVRACRLRVTGRASNKPISCTVLHVRQCSIQCPLRRHGSNRDLRESKSRRDIYSLGIISVADES